MSNPITASGVKLRFDDVTGEVYRTYVWPGYDSITISGSVASAIDRQDGSHRVLESNGRAYFIQPSFLYMVWEVEDGKPYFRF